MKKLVIFLFVFCAGLTGGWFSHSLVTSNENDSLTAISILYGLEKDVDSARLLIGAGVFEKDIKAKFDEKFSADLLTLAAVSPELPELSAIPSRGLCKLIKYHHEVGISVNEALGEALSVYITQIEPRVMSQIKKTQEIFGGSGCGTSGKGAMCPFKDKTRCKK